MRSGVFGLAFMGVALAASSAQAEDERTRAEAILAVVVGSPGAETASRETAEAKRALERAQGMRDSGDVRHAERMEGLARTWAEAARDLLVAAVVEADQRAMEQNVMETRAKADRVRALLEETISRRGRAATELVRAESDAARRPAAAPPKDKAAPRGKPGKPKGAKK